MITEGEVKKVAALARLKLSVEEMQSFRGQLATILDFVEQLKPLVVDNVAPLTHMGEVLNVARADKAERNDSSTPEKMLEQAPERKEDFVKVKAILK